MRQQQNRRLVIILFLAHDGVSQPDVWESWRSYSLQSTSDNILFYVHSPISSPEYCKEFCDKYRLPISFGETRWCQVSLVFEFLRALESIVGKHNKTSASCKIYLVSGNDIPIKNGSLLFEGDMMAKSSTCWATNRLSDFVSEYY